MANPTIKDYAHKETVSGGGTGPDFTVTVTSGSNQKLRAVLFSRSNTVTPSSDTCTFNSVSMVRVGEYSQIESPNALTITVYEMLGPPVGAFTLHPHFSVVGNSYQLNAYVVQDCEQVISTLTSAGTNTDPVGTPWALPTLGITSTADHALIQTAAAVNTAVTLSVTSGETVLASTTQGTVLTGGLSYFDKTPAGLQTAAWQATATWGRSGLYGWLDNPVPADFLTPTEKLAGAVWAVQGTVMSGATTVTKGKTDIPVAAAYGAALSPATAEYEVSELVGGAIVLNWTAFVSPTFSQPNFSGTMKDVPEGPWLRWRVRFKDGGGTVLKTSGYSANKFGAGYRAPNIGSSTNDHMFQNGTGTADSLLSSWLALPVNGGADLFQDLGTQGAGAIELARQFHLIKPGVVILLVDCGNPGSNLKGEWDTAANSTYINYFSSIIDKIEVICGAGWHWAAATAGGNDQTGAQVTSTAQFLTSLQTFLETNVRGKLANYSGQTLLPVLFGASQRSEVLIYQPGGANDATVYYNRAIPAEVQFAQRSGVYGVFVKDLPIQVSPDLTHLSDTIGMTARSARLGDAMAVGVFGVARNYRGVYAVSKTYSAVTGLMVVTWASRSAYGIGVGTTDGVLTGVTGASVTDAGVAQTITSHVVTGRWKTTLQLPTGLTDPKFSYFAGVNPDVSHPLMLLV